MYVDSVLGVELLDHSDVFPLAGILSETSN